MTRTRPDGRRATGWAALAAGLSATAAGLALAVSPGGPPADAGAIPASPISRPSWAPPSPAPPTSVPPSSDPPSWAPPTRLVIGEPKVDAPVTSVGVNADRSLAVPDDPARLGWWIGSATPGSPRGTVLIAGHVDTAADGPGALFRLETMPLGTMIEVRAGDQVLTYKAVARRSYAKQRLPADLFRTDTAPRLALVTCGGSFRNGTYSHNVVVYAEPLSANPPSSRTG
ncbi:class F sortase [Actinoplanes sp. NPDC048796]|uniref:class F sortase n=1 Tax=unclassified Actinoplanes TaxID=2626549 RepID=UPI0033FC2C2C